MRTSFSIPPPPPPPAAQASKKSRRARLPDGAAGVRVRAVRAERASGRVRERAGGASACGLRKQGARETLRRRTGADVLRFQGSCLNIVNMKAKLSMCMVNFSAVLSPDKGTKFIGFSEIIFLILLQGLTLSKSMLIWMSKLTQICNLRTELTTRSIITRNI